MHRRLLVRMHIPRQQNGFLLLCHIGFLSGKEADFSQSVLLFQQFLHKKFLRYSLPDNLRLRFLFFFLKLLKYMFSSNFFSFFSPFNSENNSLFWMLQLKCFHSVSWSTTICTSDKWWYFTFFRWAVCLSTALPFGFFPSDSPAHFPNKWGCCAASREVPFTPSDPLRSRYVLYGSVKYEVIRCHCMIFPDNDISCRS